MISLMGFRPLSPNSAWQVSNFSLQYHYLIKRAGHENKGNDHQRQTVLIFKQILSTSTYKKYMESNKENMHVDIRA